MRSEIMSQKINTEEFLGNARIGLWRIEVEEGKEPRFYADEVMDELLGITEEVTPEERFSFHRRVCIQMIYRCLIRFIPHKKIMILNSNWKKSTIHNI